MAHQRNREQNLVLHAGSAEPPAAEQGGGSPARLTDNMSDMLIRNPAPDGSPSREPVGTYRIISR